VAFQGVAFGRRRSRGSQAANKRQRGTDQATMTLAVHAAPFLLRTVSV
jgi:hypothetical protein